MATNKALEQRNTLKARKPVFRQQDAHKRKKVSGAWRKPRGYQSKMRLGRRGYSRCPSDGWGSPRAAEGLMRNGLKPVMVANLAQLDKIEPKTECAIFIASLGGKKREQLLLRAKERKVTVATVKDIDASLKTLKEGFEQRHAARDERTAVKTKKAEKKSIEQKAAEAKDAQAKQPDAEKSAEEKADELEAEKQKVLTKGM